MGAGLLTLGLALRVMCDTRYQARAGAAIQLATASLPRFTEALLWWDVLRRNTHADAAAGQCSAMNWGLTSVWLPAATIAHLCLAYHFAPRRQSPLWTLLIAGVAYMLLWGRRHACSTVDADGRLQTLSHPLWMTVVLHVAQQRLQHTLTLAKWLSDPHTYLPLVLALCLQKHTFKHVLCASSCALSLAQYL
jgi:hypothetical protein